MNVAEVKLLLINFRRLLAEKKIYELASHDLYRNAFEETNYYEIEEKSNLNHFNITLVRSWLLILSEEEKFVVMYHLIDALPWTLVIIEFENRWGKENGRSERTLKRIQALSIRKIIDFNEKMQLTQNRASPYIATNESQTPIRGV